MTHMLARLGAVIALLSVGKAIFPRSQGNHRGGSSLPTSSSLFKISATAGIGIFLIFVQIVAGQTWIQRSQTDPALAVRASDRHASTEIPEVSKQGIVKAYGKLPLSFEANRGQTDGQVKFLSRGGGYTLFLTPDQAVLSLRKPIPPSESPRKRGEDGSLPVHGGRWVSGRGQWRGTRRPGAFSGVASWERQVEGGWGGVRRRPSPPPRREP